MVDHTDDPKPMRRIEVITSVGRRRRWGSEEKARIVAESFARGAVVAEVARRHDMRAQQVHGWRRDAREGRLVLPAGVMTGELVSFAPVIISPPDPSPPSRTPRTGRHDAPLIEIEAKGVVVRVRDGAALVEAMLRVLTARA